MRKLLEELFATYHRDVYNYLYSLCHDVALSEDLTSEVFLQVVKSIGGFRGESDIKTWLFSIARHQWYNYLRKKNRQVKTESLEAVFGTSNPTAEVRGSRRQELLVGRLAEHGMQSADLRGPDATYPDKELSRRFFELLDKEPERTREIVGMRLEGYSFYEIAKKHGISERSARVIDFRAKAKIREILKKEGFGHE